MVCSILTLDQRWAPWVIVMFMFVFFSIMQASTSAWKNSRAERKLKRRRKKNERLDQHTKNGNKQWGSMAHENSFHFLSIDWLLEQKKEYEEELWGESKVKIECRGSVLYCCEFQSFFFASIYFISPPIAPIERNILFSYFIHFQYQDHGHTKNVQRRSGFYVGKMKEVKEATENGRNCCNFLFSWFFSVVWLSITNDRPSALLHSTANAMWVSESDNLEMLCGYGRVKEFSRWLKTSHSSDNNNILLLCISSLEIISITRHNWTSIRFDRPTDLRRVLRGRRYKVYVYFTISSKMLESFASEMNEMREKRAIFYCKKSKISTIRVHIRVWKFSTYVVISN